MIYKRNYPNIQEYLDLGKSVLVLGSRGAGKTYFLSKIAQNFAARLQIDLLNSTTFQRYLKDPELLYLETENLVEKSSGKVVCIFIDEVQRLPVLLNEVHRAIEAFKNKCVFILTGSSARKLKREDANLLAGRAIRINFFPLTSSEFDFRKNLDQVLQFGTLPEVVSTSSVKFKIDFLKTYVGTYLEEEIKRESEIRHLDKFSRFLEIAGVENSKPINFAKIGRSVDVSGPTTKEYYQILVDTLLCSCIPAWTHSLRKQLQQAPKYYFFDNGVLNALVGELGTELKESTYRYGRLFENLVVNELIRQISLTGSPLKLYHYRTNAGKEIDLILQKNPHSEPIAIEIKSSLTPDIRDFTELNNFSELFPKARRYVFCRAPQPYKKEGITFIHFLDGIREVCE